MDRGKFFEQVVVIGILDEHKARSRDDDGKHYRVEGHPARHRGQGKEKKSPEYTEIGQAES